MPYLVSCIQKNNVDKSNQAERQVKLQIEKQSSPVKFSIRGIDVVDSNTIWLSGAKGSIVRTTNGGKLWEQVNPPDNDSLDFRSIVAFSENKTIIASAGYPARIYRTENAGESWQLTYENKDSAAFINSMVFRDKNEGIAFGDKLNNRHLILRTVDRGENWSRIDSSNIPVPMHIEHGFSASGTCIALNDKKEYFIALGGESTRVFKSSDGISWSAYQTKMISGSDTKGIYSIAFGKDRLMAVGGDYTKPDLKYHPTYSDKGGTSWDLTQGEVSGYRSVIDYVEKTNIWITGGTNGIDYSLDDGNTWMFYEGVNCNVLRFDEQSGKGWMSNQKGEIYTLEFKPY